MKFIGEEKEINLKTKFPEFIEWKWVKIDELPIIIVDFKKEFMRNCYQKLKNLLINSFQGGNFIRQ